MKTLIIEDHSYLSGIYLEILTNVLNYDVVGIAKDGAEALELLTLKPEFIISDIKIPKINGMELVYNLRRNGDNAKILIISGSTDPFMVHIAMTFRINGYIDKSELNLDTLSLHIQKISKGEDHFSPLFSKIRKEILGRTDSFNRILSDREMQYLTFIASHSEAEICAIMQVKDSSLKAYRKSLYQKLRIDSFQELVRYAAQNGFLNRFNLPNYH